MADKKEEKIAEEVVPYIYDNEGEYKGTGRWDKFKSRSLKVRADGLFECYEKNKCKIQINLLKEPWSNLKQVAGKGKMCTSCWEFQCAGKTYNFASPNDNERASIMKEFKPFYDKQQLMDKSIDSSGKYNRNVPNNDDYKEVQLIFYYSISPKYNNTKDKQRNKDAAKHLLAFKKDPYWKRDLYLLKVKHGVLQVDLFKKKEEEEQKEKEERFRGKKEMFIKLANQANKVLPKSKQKQMNDFIQEVEEMTEEEMAKKADAMDAKLCQMSRKGGQGAALATAVVATGGVAIVVHHEVSKNPDGKVTKVIESVPVLGYAASASHAYNGDNDRAQRAAAKCTASTIKVGTGLATGMAIAAAAPTGGASLAFVGAAAAVGAGAGAAAGGVSLLAESQIAKGIKDESIKEQCKQGTAEEYAKAIGGGAVTGAIGGAMGGGALDLVPVDIDVVKDVVGIAKEVNDINDVAKEVTGNATDIGKATAIQMYEKKGNMDDWEYNPQQMDNIYIMTGQGMKYICCDKSGKINCEKGKNGTRFESIPHQTDQSKVALKSNGYYLCINENKNKVITSKNVYYFKVSSQSNGKFSFVSPNGHYLYFKKKGGFGKGYSIATKLKKDIKLAEIKFFVSNISK